MPAAAHGGQLGSTIRTSSAIYVSWPETACHVAAAIRASDPRPPCLVDALRSGRTFTEEEIAVAVAARRQRLEHGQLDYSVQVADVEDRGRRATLLRPTAHDRGDLRLYWLGRTRRRAGAAWPPPGPIDEEELGACAPSRSGRDVAQGAYGAARSLYERMGLS